jgi:hypothetical protein
MKKTTISLLALSLLVPPLFAEEPPTKRELRLLLRAGSRIPEALLTPPENKYDGFIIEGPERFVRETKEGLARIEKYAPEHYRIAKLYVKKFQYRDAPGGSGVIPRITGSTITIRKRDCVNSDYGDWFDSTLIHEIQHCDYGDGRNYASSGTEPAARWGTWYYCSKIDGFHPYYLAYIKAYALSSGYSQSKWENRYYK